MVKAKQGKRFPRNIRERVSKRASYICSNPNCHHFTLCASDAGTDLFISIGKAAHITAGAANGPRYDPSLTSEQRSSADNAIFLCSSCEDMIDYNNGLDYPVDLLEKWKSEHEAWVKENLNKPADSLISTIDGEHYAKGKGKVTAIHATAPVLIKPGTKSTAEGEGDITATRIGHKEERKR